MTKSLYLEDSYLKEFDAVVEDVQEGRLVVLDQTAFYPVGGGQPTDTGVLKANGEEFKVLNVRKKEGKVLHEVDREGLKLGDSVHGSIDWERRYRLMRLHTAAHILSAVIHKETGALITGNQKEEDKARVDFSVEKFDKEDLPKYEERVNSIIKEGKEVKIGHVSREEAKKIPELFKLADVLPPAVKEIRTVEIEGADIQACGGTHIKNTSEIESIKILETKNKGAKNKRIYFTIP